jgi:hypothetical protein
VKERDGHDFMRFFVQNVEIVEGVEIVQIM